MDNFLSLLKLLPILLAAALVGNWFLREVKRCRAQDKPWYAPYLTPPGILILVALILPLVIKFLVP